MKQLTEKTFFYHTKCPRWVRRDLVHGNGLDALEERMIDDGLLPEVMEGLLKARGEFETVRDEDMDDAFSRTVDFMRQGVSTIYSGVLMDGHWIGRPDILERVEGKSEFGNYYYVSVDIKRISDPRGIRDEHRMQGSFYADLLEVIQKVKPTSGYIMTPSGIVMSYNLAVFEADYRLTLDRIEKILAGEEPGHILTSGCKASPFFEVCLDEAVACDELSVLNRIHRGEIDELNREGIKTVLGLASANLEVLETKIIDISFNRLSFLQRQAIALKERLHDIVEPIKFRDEAVELFFDIEADPVRDIDYLFGVLKVQYNEDGTVTEKYHAFVAEREEDEQTAWNEFTAFLNENQHAPVYHYGWYEISVCAKLIDRFGAPEGAIESWRNNFIDLNSVLRPAVIFPLSFYSLKDIAQYIGFQWRSEDAGGVNSIRWFHEWLDKGNAPMMKKIIQYNEDDVRATRVLKDWLKEKAGKK
ncbi:TM0106 family RecB-like putative nuclease [Candidatus Uhrbacteria bacterium]|nr:TM0106 family RecB-like putative nuclease [Candidatus Uhrbacteria bacterium]